MKKKSVLLFATLAFMGFAIPTQADAQSTTLYISGGASFPTGDFGDYSNTGWMAAGGVLFGIGDSGFGAGAELFYGQNNHKDEASFFQGEKTTPYGAMAIVDYAFDTGSGVMPYLFGGLGLLVHRFSADNIESESDSQFGYQFGGGVGFPIGGTTQLYIEGRYMGSSDTTFFGALAGFAFALGG